MWRIHRVESTGSTNADVTAVASQREPEGYVLVADEQTQGRGRLGRSWASPAGASLSVSVLLRPTDVPATRWPWLPLLVGVAAVDAVWDAAGVRARLKWPNDVLRDGAKLAGILVERTETPDGPAAVAGIGVNIASNPVLAGEPGVGSGHDDLVATMRTRLEPASLAGTGATRDAVLDALLNHLERRYQTWRAEPSSMMAAYRDVCVTLGNEVRAELPGGTVVTGRATDIDTSGGLVVTTSTGPTVVSAGDVVHLRPA